MDALQGMIEERVRIRMSNLLQAKFDSLQKVAIAAGADSGEIDLDWFVSALSAEVTAAFFAKLQSELPKNDSATVGEMFLDAELVALLEQSIVEICDPFEQQLS